MAFYPSSYDINAIICMDYCGLEDARQKMIFALIAQQVEQLICNQTTGVRILFGAHNGDSKK